MASQLDSFPGRRRAQATSFPRRADDPVVLVGRGVAETMLVSYKALPFIFLAEWPKAPVYVTGLHGRGFEIPQSPYASFFVYFPPDTGRSPV